MGEAKYVKSNIESIGKELEMLPEISDDERPVSTRDAVMVLVKPIRALQRKGYTVDKIAKVLTERGLKVSVHSLRGYLRVPRKKQKVSPGQTEPSTKGVTPVNPPMDGNVRAKDTGARAATGGLPPPIRKDVGIGVGPAAQRGAG